MSAPRLHLEIDAVWHKGKWRLLNSEGALCQALKPATIRALIPKGTRLSCAGLPTEWAKAVRLMGESLRSTARAVEAATPWRRRISSMASELRNRHGLNSQSRELIAERPSWAHRLAWMKRNLTSRTKHARHNSNEWTRWSRGRASSMRKREARGRDNSLEIDGFA